MAPTSSDITNWDTGWTQPQGQSGITGWDYVGTPGPASAVYLGNNWVLTAAHVGPGTFTLEGNNYSVVSGSARGIIDANGTADLTLFQISTAPDLPALTIATSPPTPFSLTQSGSQVAMIGFGGGKSWGLNTVTQQGILVQPQDTSYVSRDFETAFGTTPIGPHSVTNNYSAIVGDSGGGDFIFNSSTSHWELAGINEANDSNGDSYMVQLSSYASQINAIVATPEPSSCAFLAGGVLALLGNTRLARARKSASRARE